MRKNLGGKFGNKLNRQSFLDRKARTANRRFAKKRVKWLNEAL